MSKEEYPYELLHITECAEPFLYLKGVPLGGPIRAEIAIKPSGIKPRAGERMVCEKCQASVDLNDCYIRRRD
jgi:hypothetical protein